MPVNAPRIKLAGSLASMVSPANKARGLRLQEARRDAGFENASDAARSLNVEVPTYLAHENGSRGITTDVGAQYATRFKVEYTWLMQGKGSKKPTIVLKQDARVESTTTIQSARVAKNFALAPDVRVSMRQIPVIGYVQAGVWLQTIELPPEDRFDIPLPIQSGFDGFIVQGLIVRGPSMDEVYPHGSVLAVVKFLDLGRDPRNGERVVALRFRHGETEATVKEYRIGSDGKPRLWPRSKHPDFQSPIMVAEPRDEAEHLEVSYLVIGSYRPEL